MRDFALQKRLILAGLAILLLADAALGYYYARLSDERQNPREVLAALKRRVELVRADVNRATGIRQRIPASLSRLDEFESSFPAATRGYSSISEELGTLAVENHLLIESQSFHQQELQGRNLTEVVIENTVTGDYAGIVRFLNALQRSKSVFIVQSLELSTSNDNNAGANAPLHISLQLKTYFRKA